MFLFSPRLVDPLVCALTSFFRTHPIFVRALQHPISRRPPHSPNPQACAHIPFVPRNPTPTPHTYILYSIHHACVDSLLHSHFFFSSCCISLVSSLVPSRFVLHSLFPVCSDRFALILFVFCFPCSRIVSFLSALALVTSSICALPLSLYLFFTPLFALRDSHHLDYIGIAPLLQSSECSAFVTPMEWSPRIGSRRITQPYCLSVFGKYRIHCSTAPHADTRLIQRDYRQRQHVQCGD